MVRSCSLELQAVIQSSGLVCYATTASIWQDLCCLTHVHNVQDCASLREEVCICINAMLRA